MTTPEQLLWAAVTSSSPVANCQQVLEAHPTVDLNFVHPGDHLTPLQLACVSQNLPLLDWLLSQPGVDPNFRKGNDWTPLLLACENDSLPCVERLLQHPDIDVNQALRDGATAFFLACQLGFDTLVSRFLADQRVDMNRPIDNGTTPFHIAAEFDRLETVKLLLKHPRVDVNQARTNGATPFFMVCQKGLLAVMRLLMDDPRLDVNRGKVNGATPFIIACQKGLADVVVTLLTDPRVDCNKVLSDGHSPLAIIAGYDQVEILKLLIASGKELHAQQAIEVAKTEQLDVLPEWLDFLRSLEKPFVTPLDIARGKGHQECVALLTELEEQPRELRHRLWKNCCFREYHAGELFALLILNVDEYLRLKKAPGHHEVRRFFAVAERLPMELQMILCHRVYGHPRDIFPKKASDRAFMMLTWKIQPDPRFPAPIL